MVKRWVAAFGLAVCLLVQPVAAEESREDDKAVTLGLLLASKDFYENGDYNTAVSLWRLLAEKGSARAQGLLGGAYTVGKGVPQDHVLAYMWFNLAATQGDRKAAEVREKIAGALTREQLAKAQHLTREWLAAHPKQ